MKKTECVWDYVWIHENMDPVIRKAGIRTGCNWNTILNYDIVKDYKFCPYCGKEKRKTGKAN